MKISKGPAAFDDEWWLVPWPTTVFSLGTQSQVGEGDTNLEAPHRVRRQRSAQVSQSLSEPMALEIRHPQSPIARTLIADLPTDHFHFSKEAWKGIVSALPDDPLAEEVRTNGKGSRGRCARHTPPPCPLRTTTFEARHQPALLPWPVLPSNYAPAGGRARTTPRGCGRDRHSSGRALAGERCPSRHTTASLRSCKSWPWHLLPFRISRPPPSQPGHKDRDIIGERGNLGSVAAA